MRALLARLRGIGPRRRDVIGLTAAVAAWVVALVLVAAAGQAVVIQRVERTTSPAPAPAAPAATAPLAAPTIGGPVIGPYLRVAPPLPLGEPTTTSTTTPFDLGVSAPLESSPLAASLLPSLPAITLPPLPPELAPLLAVAAPSVRQVCSTTGVAIVVAALVKGDLEGAGIPVTQALTYLGPVLATCALFPPDEPSICSVDTALNNALIPKDLQILVGVPPLAALGIDQIASVENLLRSTGLPLPPGITASLATALGCELK
jgi:hypothetical protein